MLRVLSALVEDNIFGISVLHNGNNIIVVHASVIVVRAPAEPDLEVRIALRIQRTKLIRKWNVHELAAVLKRADILCVRHRVCVGTPVVAEAPGIDLLGWWCSRNANLSDENVWTLLLVEWADLTRAWWVEDDGLTWLASPHALLLVLALASVSALEADGLRPTWSGALVRVGKSLAATIWLGVVLELGVIELRGIELLVVVVAATEAVYTVEARVASAVAALAKLRLRLRLESLSSFQSVTTSHGRRLSVGIELTGFQFVLLTIPREAEGREGQKA